MSAYVHSIFSFVPHKSAYSFRLHATLCNGPSAPLLPAVHSVRITFHYSFNTVIQSIERCGAKQTSDTVTKPTPVLWSPRRYYCQYLD